MPAADPERWAQQVRNDTLAESRITATIAGKIATTAARDGNIVQRGTERRTARIVGRQRPVEDVAVRTLQALADQGDLPPGAAAPAEDFMRSFEDMAERAATEAVADLPARVLAGGSASLEASGAGRFGRWT